MRHANIAAFPVRLEEEELDDVVLEEVELTELELEETELELDASELDEEELTLEEELDELACANAIAGMRSALSQTNENLFEGSTDCMNIY